MVKLIQNIQFSNIFFKLSKESFTVVFVHFLRENFVVEWCLWFWKTKWIFLVREYWSWNKPNSVVFLHSSIIFASLSSNSVLWSSEKSRSLCEGFRCWLSSASWKSSMVSFWLLPKFFSFFFHVFWFVKLSCSLVLF